MAKHTRCFTVLGVLATLAAGSRADAQTSIATWGRSIGPTPKVSNIVRLFAASDHAVGLRSDGSLVGWGSNANGQLNFPTDLPRVLEVAVAEACTVVVLEDRTVRVIGGGADGQANVPIGLSGVRVIGAGTFQVLAGLENGSVVGWGITWTGASNPPAGLSNVLQLDGGVWHSLALDYKGRVHAWGPNWDGAVAVPSDLGEVAAISAGRLFSVALTQGGIVRAWGSNQQYQTNVPATLSQAVGISAGGIHSAAVLPNGGVVAWGFNNIGQCLGTDASGSPILGDALGEMVQINSTLLTNVLQVAVGTDFAVALVGPPGPDADADGFGDEVDNCPGIANPFQLDCNSNGVGDVCEIAAGAPDFNHDTIPDTCQCIADLVLADHQVNGADLGALLSQWGPANVNTVSDMNRDGKVDGADLGHLLASWGPCTN